MTSRTAVLVAAIGLSLGLAACETATPYQPLQRGTHVSGGYTDQKLDTDHFQVTFRGNTDTPRSTVESYLLYRAAELTIAQGYDWFETVEKHTERDRRTYVDPDPFYGPGYAWGYFRPYWNFWGPGYGWAGWGGYWGGDIQTVQKFEATAEIALHHGGKPPGNPRGLDAREVLSNLGPKIQRPKA
ncbi:MAG TPA: hypothetical protein VKQ54_14065 [Caulobacteraceae bacterium]|nr:hypothetical protein [Caulobacteraceae bacterium]